MSLRPMPLQPVSSRVQSLSRFLPAHASRSTIIHQHAACVIVSGRIVAYAHNEYSGTKTLHAEHNALAKFLANHGHYGWEKRSRLLRKKYSCKNSKAAAKRHYSRYSMEKRVSK